MLDRIPRINQYLGTWAISEDSYRLFSAMLHNTDWAGHFARVDQGEHRVAGPGYEVTDHGVAVIDLEGVLTKYGSSMSTEGSTVAFRQTCRDVVRAYGTGEVKAAMIVIESGGGTTMGTPEASDEVKDMTAKMPVWSYFEDIGASAGYWIGCRAGRVIANASAILGSIGTYRVVEDISGLFEKHGIKTHLFTTGKHKGAGTTGTELTEEQRAEFQSMVERMNAPFIAAVQESRGLTDEQIEDIADGRVWRGDEAVSIGLIDEVMTYEDALAELAGDASKPLTKGTVMAKPKASSKSNLKSAAIKAKSEEDKDKPVAEEDEEEPESEEEDDEEVSTEDEEEAEPEDEGEEKPQSRSKPASIKALRSALPDANSDFILKSVEKGWSLGHARMVWLEQTVKSQAKQITELESQGPKPGQRPLKLAGGKSKAITGDVVSQWKAAVKECGSTSKAVKENPELHAAYIEAINSKRAG